jgi:mono/diheme cytochrome c family protein
LTGARSVNDETAINVAQVVIGGAQRPAPSGTLAMPAFGSAYSDVEIAAVANYVTARFGAKPSTIKAEDVAKLRATR